MSINETEKILLAKILKKTENIQIKGEIWHELVKKFVTITVELCVVDNQNKIFLIRRLANDPEFKGRPYHIPGTVICDWETVDQARERLIKNEIISAGIGKITETKPIGWMEFGRESFLDRHEIALLHVSHFDGEFLEKEDAGFFSIDSIPDNIIASHTLMISIFKRYLDDGKIILGK